MEKRRPVVLTILDGWGVSCNRIGNAVIQAHTPNYDEMIENYSYTELKASGEYVGLPDNQMGNSEVGHLNIGAGRIVYQEFTRINKAIEENSFFNNDELLKAIKNAKDNNKSLHLMGLLSDGGVHSHIEHLFALIDMAAGEGLNDFYVHAILDGRDVPPDNALVYINRLEEKLEQTGGGSIATVMGRYYAMDRDNRWDRVERAYTAMVDGNGITAPSAEEAVKMSYNEGITDEFMEPAVVMNTNGNPVNGIQEGDSIIFYNFRADRAREITRAYVQEDFDSFERRKGYLNPHYVCMTQYDKDIAAPVAFPPQEIINTLGEVLAENGKRQIRIAETEKYAHVTFFFNGGIEKANSGEERVLVPSSKVATYDLKPEMSAFEVAEEAIKAVNSNNYDFIVVNFANPDMVGHTGILDAAIEAVEAVDKCLGRLLTAVNDAGGIALVTSDHGNCEVMIEENGEPHTAHSTNDVPFILINHKEKGMLDSGSLRDIAPTVLDLLNIPKPEEMTGKSLTIGLDK